MIGIKESRRKRFPEEWRGIPSPCRDVDSFLS
jgi:hypothetical protein